jgi:hypothetical protein
MAYIADYTDDLGRTDWTALRSDETDCGDRCSECGVFIATEGLGYSRRCVDCDPEAWYRGPSEHVYFVRCAECGRLTDVEDEATRAEDTGADDGMLYCGYCGSVLFAKRLDDGNYESPLVKIRPKKAVCVEAVVAISEKRSLKCVETLDWDWN